jgi:hypothetical protein
MSSEAFKQKCKNLLQRFLWFVRQWPLRLWRLILHLALFARLLPGIGLQVHYYEFYKWRILIWIGELFLNLLDLTGFPEIYETIDEWIKWKTRPLIKKENDLIQEIFGQHINTSLLLIDTKASWFARKYKIAYVTFNTVNCHGAISDDLLIHEVTHCWQYQRFGSVYILRALLGQKTKAGYDPGDLSKYNNLPMGELIKKYNYEQQAEIMSEYFKTIHGLPTTYLAQKTELITIKEQLLS